MSTPTIAKERYAVLDSLRGFALFGILLANLVSFVGYNTLQPSQIVSLPFSDRAVLFTIDWLIEGKFYTIFSLLFGMGCALQLERFSAGSAAFRGYWIRRMLILMVIGLTHMYFVWNGDILTLYSVLGLLLLLFVSLSNRTLWIATGLLLLLPIVIHIVVMATQDLSFYGSLTRFSDGWKDALGYANRTLLEMRTSSDPKEVMFINILQAVKRPMSYLISGRYPQVLGIFLIGVLFVRTLLPRIRASEPIPTKWWLVPGIFGLIMSLGYALIKGALGSYYELNYIGLLQAVTLHLGAPTLGVGLAGGFYNLWRSGQLSFIMAKLAVLGRMALTNYILQNVIAVLLFFGYGFGLMGKLPFVVIPVVALIIFFIQTWFSSIWLSRFSQGPLELIWKRLAYGADK